MKTPIFDPWNTLYLDIRQAKVTDKTVVCSIFKVLLFSEADLEIRKIRATIMAFFAMKWLKCRSIVIFIVLLLRHYCSLLNSNSNRHFRNGLPIQTWLLQTL